MCGILFISKTKDAVKAKEMSKRMSHRGPDESGLYLNENKAIMLHERLSIIDLKTGTQPIQRTNNAYVIHNGEIYNYEILKSCMFPDSKFRTNCDSEIIIKLYEKYGIDFCNKLDS